jgi:hypothetical protein
VRLVRCRSLRHSHGVTPNEVRGMAVGFNGMQAHKICFV